MYRERRRLYERGGVLKRDKGSCAQSNPLGVYWIIAIL